MEADIVVDRNGLRGSERGGDTGLVVRETVAFSDTAQPLSSFQSTKNFELIFRALLNSDGSRDVRFERTQVSSK
jgi:hypothetical protein